MRERKENSTFNGLETKIVLLRDRSPCHHGLAPLSAKQVAGWIGDNKVAISRKKGLPIHRK